jgi:hypothetical protein
MNMGSRIVCPLPLSLQLSLTFVLSATAATPPQALLHAPVVASFSTPGKNTVGLTWDGARFWAADRGGDGGWIYYCEGCGGGGTATWVKAFPWKEGRLGTITWGEGGLWVVDERRGKLLFVPVSPALSGPSEASASGQPPQVTKELPIPPTALREPPVVTGVAWDGAKLWLVTGCGLCSSFFSIDAKDGRVLQEFFPRCEPRGLVWGELNNTGYLWTIAYNGPKHPPGVSSRIPGQDRKFVVLRHHVGPFVPVTTSAIPTEPTAITFAKDTLWVVDRANGTVLPFSPDEARK